MTTATWQIYHQVITDSQRSILHKRGRVRDKQVTNENAYKVLLLRLRKISGMLHHMGLYDTQTFHIQDVSQKYLDWGDITVLYLPWLQVGIVPMYLQPAPISLLKASL